MSIDYRPRRVQWVQLSDGRAINLERFAVVLSEPDGHNPGATCLRLMTPSTLPDSGEGVIVRGDDVLRVQRALTSLSTP